MIIDSHCHAARRVGLGGRREAPPRLRRYLERAARAGIDRTVLLADFSRDYRRANREVAAIVARHPGRLTGYVFVHAARDRGRIAELVSEGIEGYGFRGIKVHGHDAPITAEICEQARRWRVPVLYDVVGRIRDAEVAAARYPDVDFVIPHLGSFNDDTDPQVRFITGPLTRFDNVHTDTAGVRQFDLLLDAVHRVGPHKFLFGSDGTWLHPGLELHKVRLLGLEPEAERLVLAGNLLRLLNRSTVAGALGVPS